MQRRTLLTAIPAATVATVASPFTLASSTSGLTPAPVRAAAAVRYCLNTSTLRGQKLGIVREVTIAAQAGYQGLEPWIPNLREFVQQGGSLADLRKQITRTPMPARMRSKKPVVTWTCCVRLVALGSPHHQWVLIRATVHW
jgi:hypothetical protein